MIKIAEAASRNLLLSQHATILPPVLFSLWDQALLIPCTWGGQWRGNVIMMGGQGENYLEL